MIQAICVQRITAPNSAAQGGDSFQESYWDASAATS